MHAQLQAHFTDPQIVELTFLIGFINMLNLFNNALQITNGKFIVVLDCDHVPAADFIEKTLGFFLEDEKLFLVQTAHNFVTPDPLERNLLTDAHSPTENEKFFHAIMPGLDYWGAAFFCGSAAMLRRSALHDIGGFSAETVTEDAALQSVTGFVTGISAGTSSESNQSLNFIVSNSNSGLFSVQPSITSAGQLSYIPAANANGSAIVSNAVCRGFKLSVGS